MKTFRSALVLLVALGLLGPGVSRAQPASSPTGAFCGVRPDRPRHYAHVVWIWFENRTYTDIVGSSQAPYFNSLIASCGLATNYHNLTHLSLPNYLGAVSGLRLSELQPFLADCNPGPGCTTDAKSLFEQVPTWKAYEESMPENCAMQNSGQYAVRHNPPPYFTRLATTCPLFDVPYTELQGDLDADTLPAFSFITPNVCDDLHDCPVATGDAWLQGELPKIFASAAYQSGTTVILVTFDEGRPGFNVGEDCATNTTDASCHIPTIVISPYTPAGTTSDRLFNHYSLLKTTEQLLGVRRRLGAARQARSMRRAFHL